MVLGGSRVTGAVSPPRLLEGVRNPEPEYPGISRLQGEQGVVAVLLHVSEAGTVSAVDVVQGSGYPLLDEAAKKAVLRWRLRPAMRDGAPVPGSVRTSIHFRLQR
jgi:protein TonB